MQEKQANRIIDMQISHAMHKCDQNMAQFHGDEPYFFTTNEPIWEVFVRG